MIVSPLYSTVLLNFIIERYLCDVPTICVLWNHEFPFELKQSNYENYVALISLYVPSFDEDFYTVLEDLTLRTSVEVALTESIYKSHCVNYVVFEHEIGPFVRSFLKSSIYSPWHAINNRFLFAYTKGRLNTTKEFNHLFFADQSDILFIEAVNTTAFNLKTTKFVGSREGHPDELILLDTYYGDRGVFQLNHNLYPDKARNLQGRELKVIGFHYPPFSIITNDTSETNVMNIGNGNKDTTKKLAFNGLDSEVLFQFCKIYNCTLQFYLSKENEWGNIYDNLTGDGFLELILKRKADIAMMACYMWTGIFPYLDITNTYGHAGITCLVPKPSRVTSWYLVFRPFQIIVWGGIGVCLIFEAIALVTTRKVGRDEPRIYSWLESFKFGSISTLKLFISQSTNYLVNSTSVRVVLFSCYVIDIIITSTYSGGLATILTIPSLEEAPDTIERMVQQKLLWGGTTTGWLLNFNDVTDPTIIQLAKNFRAFTPEELRQKSLHEDFGLVLERLQFGHFAVQKYIKRDAILRYKVMLEDLYTQYCVAYTQRSWPLLEKYNNYMMMIQSSGMLKIWETHVVRTFLDRTIQDHIMASASIDYDELGPVALGMDNFAGIIVIWLAGIILSSLSFVAELFLKLSK